MNFNKLPFLFLFILTTFNLTGQCGEGLSITLSTQTGVDNFVKDYCVEFEGNLQIVDNNDTQDNITNLDSLLSMKRINGVLQIVKNPFLERLSGLDSISYLGAIRIVNNPLLTNLDGLNAFESIFGDIIIKENNGLLNLDALLSLSTMLSPAGYIIIDNNAKLQDITGLSSLSSIVGGIVIRENAELPSLNGLQNISIMIDSDSPIAEDIEITDNEALNECSIESICLALQSETITYDIRNNGVSCDSKDYILSNCNTSTVDNDLLKLNISPNPVIDQMSIYASNKELIEIYNSIGYLKQRIQLERGFNNFDISQFENGIYFIKTINGVVYRIMKI